MSTNLSKLADELKPYFVPWVRKIAQGGNGAGSTGGTADMLAHELASTSALGTYHTVSGLTAGQVLKATGAATAAFGQLLHSQLGGIGANDHHAMQHSITDGAHHTIAGSNLDVVSNVGGAVGVRAGSSDVSAGASAYLYAVAGAVGLRKVTSTDTLDFDSATDRIRVLANNRIGTDNYVSQVTGWGIDYQGGADFRYVYTDEMHAKSFIADLEQALAGGQIISKSVAVLAADFALPVAGAAATIRVNDLPSAPSMAVFVAGDLIRLRKFSRAGGSLTIADAWGVVTAYADGSGANEGTQTWTFTRSAGALAGTATGTVSKDAIVLDYGVSGDGLYEVNAIDGIYAQNSPYAQVLTWIGHPLSTAPGEGLKVRTRTGNLRGNFAIANEYGFYAGNGSTDADTYVRLSSYTNKINNLPIEWWSSGTRIVTINPTEGINIAGSEWISASGLLPWELPSPIGSQFKYSASLGLSSGGLSIYHVIVDYPYTTAYYNLGVIEVAKTLNWNGSTDVYGSELKIIADHVTATGDLRITGAISGATGTFSSTLVLDTGVISSQIDLVGILNHGGAQWVYLNDPAGNSLLNLGYPRTVDGPSYIDLYTHAGGGIKARWIRWGGANGEMDLQNYGTGNLKIGQVNAGNIGFYTQNADRAYIMYTGEINSLYGYQRNGVDGCIFVPIGPFNMVDTGSVTWSGVSRGVGTYTFDVNSADNGTVPADAKAVALFVTGTWTNYSNSNYITIQAPGGNYSMVVRAQQAGVGSDGSGIVRLDTNGQFTVTVAGATSNVSLLRIVGYYI